MRRIVFITLYDEFCYGARSIAATLRAHGHDVHFLHFKVFTIPLIRYDDHERRKTIQESDSISIPAIFPDGERYIPFPTPVTETEVQILIDQLREREPDVIGFTLLSVHIPLARRLTRRMKEEFPKTPVIWGGIHPIIRTEECIQDADAVCTGEGELCTLELLEDPRRQDVKGFWFRDGNGHVIRNEPLRLNTDLDGLPYPSYTVNEWQIEGDTLSDMLMTVKIFIQDHYRITTARNCPYRCTFCHHSTFQDIYRGQRYVRRRSVDNVIDELKLRKRDLDLEYVCFIDDVFAMHRPWVEEFAAKYKREIGLPFYGNLHPHATKPNMLPLLKDVGMVHTGFGLQSGSRKMVYDVFRRGTSNEENQRLVQHMIDTGFDEVRLDILTNTKYEDEADCLETLQFLCSLPKPFMLQLFTMYEFPTSKLSSMKNLPRGSMTPEGFFHYNMLYTLTQNDRLPSEAILAMAKDPFLRSHPRVMADIATAVISPDEQTRGMQWKIKELNWRLQNASVRDFAKQRLKERLPEPVKKVLRPVRNVLRGSSRG